MRPGEKKCRFTHTGERKTMVENKTIKRCVSYVFKRSSVKIPNINDHESRGLGTESSVLKTGTNV